MSVASRAHLDKIRRIANKEMGAKHKIISKTKRKRSQTSNVDERCVFCLKKEEEDGRTWVACDECDRWMHVDCLPDDVEFDPTSPFTVVRDF